MARAKVVSWLRAASLTFPAYLRQWYYERALCCPIQWRGRAGISPVSVAPARESIVPEDYRRRSARASAKIIEPPMIIVSAIM